MIRVSEERKSNNILISFIDLLFLLVAFFTLLLFFLQSRHQASQEELKAVQQSIARITGDEVDISEVARKLEPMLERFMAKKESEVAKEKERVEKALRKKQRSTFRLKYTITAHGKINYRGKSYTLQNFREKVVKKLRATRWIAFQGVAAADTPFGQVVKSRAVLLQDSNEFDSYWDNVSK